MKKLLLGLCLTLFTTLSTAQEPPKTMPEWQLKDANGNTVSAADFAGKPVVIHFWATWCPYCKKLQPGLQRLYREYHDKGLEMIAISFNEDEGATPQAVFDKRGISFKTLVDGDDVARLFGVAGTPTTFFYEANGELLGVSMNSDPDDPQLERAAQYLTQGD